ncbi:hypothetical protein L1049_021430 [Liquidambar formosana]|uniref:Uncharacterized protein n=1 Tax=Liquidambar formosana TaxID=63359 RepID=A0AAP0R3F5_LIQFO
MNTLSLNPPHRASHPPPPTPPPPPDDNALPGPSSLSETRIGAVTTNSYDDIDDEENYDNDSMKAFTTKRLESSTTRAYSAREERLNRESVHWCKLSFDLSALGSTDTKDYAGSALPDESFSLLSYYAVFAFQVEYPPRIPHPYPCRVVSCRHGYLGSSIWELLKRDNCMSICGLNAMEKGIDDIMVSSAAKDGQYWVEYKGQLKKAEQWNVKVY